MMPPAGRAREGRAGQGSRLEGRMGRIYVVGTADTKGEELAFLGGIIRARGGDPVVVDVGMRVPTVPVDVPATEVAKHGAPGILEGHDRGTAVAGMAEAFAAFVKGRSDIGGMIGVGGGGGTSIVTAGMRMLPIGIPKIMVSTLASGDVSPYVGVSDIMMMPSITDLAGLNRISRVILANAAEAIAAMGANPHGVSGGKPGCNCRGPSPTGWSRPTPAPWLCRPTRPKRPSS